MSEIDAENIEVGMYVRRFEGQSFLHVTEFERTHAGHILVAGSYDHEPGIHDMPVMEPTDPVQVMDDITWRECDCPPPYADCPHPPPGPQVVVP